MSQKAYDKAWLDAIMFIMHKEGLTGKEWSLTQKLNSNLTASIKTKNGMTRKIRIKDSIRQGGVLSVTQYALMMDEITKEIQRENIKMTQNNNQTMGCLLWMDDVAIISDNPKDNQKMLDITNEIANRYHIEFGKEKSKSMKIGRKGEKTQLKAGELDLEYTDKYKYLGITFNEKNNMENQISEATRKA